MSLNDYLNKLFESKYSATTTKNRIRFLVSIAPKDAKDLLFLKNTKKIKKELDKYENISTKANNLNHIVKAIEVSDNILSDNILNFYKEWLEDLFKQKENIRQNNIKKETDREIDIDDLENKLDNYFKQFKRISKPMINKLIKENRLIDFIKEYQKLVLLACYVYQPALRNDWGNMVILYNIKNQNNKENYIYLGKKNYLIMNVYKTANKYGQQKIDLNSKLVKVIKNWISIYKIIRGEEPYYILYYNIDKSGFTHNDSSSLSMIIKRVSKEYFNNEYSINDYRKAHTKNIIEQPNYMKLTQLQKNKLHMMLLHSTYMAEQDYNKI